MLCYWRVLIDGLVVVVVVALIAWSAPVGTMSSLPTSKRFFPPNFSTNIGIQLSYLPGNKAAWAWSWTLITATLRVELRLHPHIFPWPSEGHSAVCSMQSSLSQHCTVLFIVAQQLPGSTPSPITMYCPKGAPAVRTDGMSSWCLMLSLTKIRAFWTIFDVPLGERLSTLEAAS
jgi:hypothetical protein